MNGMKNIDKSTVLKLKEQVAYQPGQVVSRTLAQNDALSVTLYSIVMPAGHPHAVYGQEQFKMLLVVVF